MSYYFNMKTMPRKVAPGTQNAKFVRRCLSCNTYVTTIGIGIGDTPDMCPRCGDLDDAEQSRLATCDLCTAKKCGLCLLYYSLFEPRDPGARLPEPVLPSLEES